MQYTYILAWDHVGKCSEWLGWKQGSVYLLMHFSQQRAPQAVSKCAGILCLFRVAIQSHITFSISYLLGGGGGLYLFNINSTSLDVFCFLLYCSPQLSSDWTTGIPCQTLGGECLCCYERSGKPRSSWLEKHPVCPYQVS